MKVFCGDNFKKRYNKGNSRPPAEGRLSKQKTKNKTKKEKNKKTKSKTKLLYIFIVHFFCRFVNANFYFLQEKRFEK